MPTISWSNICLETANQPLYLRCVRTDFPLLSSASRGPPSPGGPFLFSMRVASQASATCCRQRAHWGPPVAARSGVCCPTGNTPTSSPRLAHRRNTNCRLAMGGSSGIQDGRRLRVDWVSVAPNLVSRECRQSDASGAGRWGPRSPEDHYQDHHQDHPAQSDATGTAASPGRDRAASKSGATDRRAHHPRHHRREGHREGQGYPRWEGMGQGPGGPQMPGGDPPEPPPGGI